MHKISFSTQSRQQIVNLTPRINECIQQNGYQSGIMTVYCPHTTAGLSVNENADPDVKKDLTQHLNKLVPQDESFSHAEGNSDAHIKGSLMGFSYSFIIEDSELQLGTWQGVFFMEFDGPRPRNVWIKFVGN